MTPPAVPSVAGDAEALVDALRTAQHRWAERGDVDPSTARRALLAYIAQVERERDEARAAVEHAYREGGALYDAEIRAREEESRAEKAEAEVDRLRKRLSTRETARDVAMHRVYQAADEILAFLPVPGWEHSAEASAVYERLLRSVREVKRLVKRKRRMKERRAASAIVHPGGHR